MKMGNDLQPFSGRNPQEYRRHIVEYPCKQEGIPKAFDQVKSQRGSREHLLGTSRHKYANQASKKWAVFAALVGF